MAIATGNIAAIILAGFDADPKDIEAARALMAKKGEEEIAYYNSLSAEEQADYDALTEGMMPRLAKMPCGHPTGGRT